MTSPVHVIRQWRAYRRKVLSADRRTATTIKTRACDCELDQRNLPLVFSGRLNWLSVDLDQWPLRE